MLTDQLLLCYQQQLQAACGCLPAELPLQDSMQAEHAQAAVKTLLAMKGYRQNYMSACSHTPHALTSCLKRLTALQPEALGAWDDMDTCLQLWPVFEMAQAAQHRHAPPLSQSCHHRSGARQSCLPRCPTRGPLPRCPPLEALRSAAQPCCACCARWVLAGASSRGSAAAAPGWAWAAWQGSWPSCPRPGASSVALLWEGCS